MATMIIKGKKMKSVDVDWKEFYYTNCPLVSPSNVDQEIGWVKEEFKKIGVKYAEKRLTSDGSYNVTLGRAYVDDLLDRLWQLMTSMRVVLFIILALAVLVAFGVGSVKDAAIQRALAGLEGTRESENVRLYLLDGLGIETGIHYPTPLPLLGRKVPVRLALHGDGEWKPRGRIDGDVYVALIFIRRDVGPPVFVDSPRGRQ